MEQQTPKEKAQELCNKYYNRLEHKLSEEYSPHEKDVVKECALIAVDEILSIGCIEVPYWYEVKQEITNL